MTTLDYLKKIKDKVYSVLPSNAEVTKITLEGPEVVIYTKNPSIFYNNEQNITKIASELKKRVRLRCDSTLLMPEAEAKKKILEIVPEDAQITDIKFIPAFNQVNIEAVKLGVVIGKGGETLKKIVLETGWTPELLRAPLQPSDILKGIRYYLYKHAAERKQFLINVAEKIYQEPRKKDNWLRVHALGGAREVGRSAYLLETANSKVLLDCGVNVAAKTPEDMYPRLDTLNFPITEIDAVIITHAHLDHSGFIPYLYALDLKAPVYCTEPTRDLMALLQLDYLKVLAREDKPLPYSEIDIKKVTKHCIPRKYEEVTDITPDLRLTLYNAGHILGSATIHIHEGNGEFNLIYTGDIKYGYTALLDPAQNHFARAEGLIIESTYGGPQDVQEPRKVAEERLITTINKTISNGGNVLIPTFAVGRAQEVMLILERAYKKGQLNAKVYTDGMIKQASAIHTAYPDFLKRNIQQRTLRNDSPFISDLFQDIENINREEILKEGGAVILAPSGMLVGGPSVEYFKLMAEDEKNSLIFVGYQAEGSLGRKIQKGVRELSITDSEGKIKHITVNMHIESIPGFSGHSDRRELVSYVHKLQPKLKRILVNHGDERNAANLAAYYQKTFKIESYAPRTLETLRLR